MQIKRDVQDDSRHVYHTLFGRPIGLYDGFLSNVLVAMTTWMAPRGTANISEVLFLKPHGFRDPILVSASLPFSNREHYLGIKS